MLDKAEYSAFESTLNSLYRIVSYRIVSWLRDRLNAIAIWTTLYSKLTVNLFKSVTVDLYLTVLNIQFLGLNVTVNENRKDESEAETPRHARDFWRIPLPL